MRIPRLDADAERHEIVYRIGEMHRPAPRAAGVIAVHAAQNKAAEMRSLPGAEQFQFMRKVEGVRTFVVDQPVGICRYAVDPELGPARICSLRILRISAALRIGVSSERLDTD